MASENRTEYAFSWKIENYSMCYRKHKESLKSPSFIPTNLGGSKWYLTFFPSGRKDKDSKSYVLNRSTEDLGAEEISVSFILEVMDGNNAILVTRGNDSSRYKFKRGTRLGWDDLSLTKHQTDSLTLRCRIIGNSPSSSNAVTEVEIERCSFSWIIDSNCLVSGLTRKFSFSKTAEYEINVASQVDQIEIKICKITDTIAARVMDGKISLINPNGEKVSSQRAKHLFDVSDGETWKYPNFISKNLLELDDNLKKDSFTLLCEFSASNGRETSCNPNANSSFATKLNNMISLNTDLKNMFLNTKYSDIQIKTKNVLLPAHKTVLSARSPVFSAMFEQNMLENQSGIVEIPDIEEDILKLLLEFIYTGIVKFQDYKSVLKLLIAAEKYQVLSLKEECSEYLLPALSLENVDEILVTADLLRLKQLKKCALDFVGKHIAEISSSCEWLEFIEENGKLAAEIFTYLANHFEIKPKTN